MKKPVVTECDLCRNEIPRGIKHAALAIPLSSSDRSEIRAEVERELPKNIAPPSMFGPFVIQESMVPEVWQFDVCMGCIEGLMPMLRELKTSQIRRILRDKADARERAKQQDQEEQEAP